MMRYFFIFVVFIAFISGSALFLINRELIVVKWNGDFFNQHEEVDETKKNLILRKNLNLYYWQDEKFNIEIINTVWFSQKSENIKHIVNQWLSFLHDERIIDKKIYLESASLTETEQEVYLSFDQIPLLRDWSIFNKLCFIQSLLKTINKSGIGIQKVFFLVDHQVMEDDHLDFSAFWSIDGFLGEM
ncbi:MAG: hypothetical protein ABIA74_03390 [bacterium]